MHRIRGKLTYANVVATLALFIALGGASYAATRLPKNSVGAKQLRKGAVTPAKLSKASKSALVGPGGPRGATGAQGPNGAQGAPGQKGDPGAPATSLWAAVQANGVFARESGVVSTGKLGNGKYYVEFGRDVTQCSFQVTSGEVKGATPAAVPVGVAPSIADSSAVEVWTSNTSGAFESHDFYVAAFC
jgi:hypothetical protein